MKTLSQEIQNQNKKYELSIYANTDYNDARSDIESIVNQLNFKGCEVFDGDTASIYVSSKSEVIELTKEAKRLINESDAKDGWTGSPLLNAHALENIFDEDGEIFDCVNL